MGKQAEKVGEGIYCCQLGDRMESAAEILIFCGQGVCLVCVDDIWASLWRRDFVCGHALNC